MVMTFQKALMAVTAAAVLGWTGVSHASVVDLGSGVSNPSPIDFSSSGISGLTSLSYSGAPNDIRYTSKPDTATFFPDQSGSTIASGISSLFGLSPLTTLTEVLDDTS